MERKPSCQIFSISNNVYWELHKNLNIQGLGLEWLLNCEREIVKL